MQRLFFYLSYFKYFTAVNFFLHQTSVIQIFKDNSPLLKHDYIFEPSAQPYLPFCDNLL